jgi:hypothetical protein
MINQKISTPTEAPNEVDTSFNNYYQQVEWIPKNQNHLEMKLKN